MAVTKLLEMRQGRSYCLVLDSWADTAVVVGPDGFDMDDGEPELRPGYFEEHRSLFVRRDDVTDQPVGLMIEHASRWGRPRRRFGWRRDDDTFGLIEYLLTCAHWAFADPPNATESLFPQPEAPEPLRRMADPDFELAELRGR